MELPAVHRTQPISIGQNISSTTHVQLLHNGYNNNNKEECTAGDLMIVHAGQRAEGLYSCIRGSDQVGIIQWSGSGSGSRAYKGRLTPKVYKTIKKALKISKVFTR